MNEVDKPAIRREMRRRLARPMLSVIAQVAVDRVRQLPEWQAAGTVLLFSPLPDELDVRPLFESQTPQVLVPRLHDAVEGAMEAVVVNEPPPSEDGDAAAVHGWSKRRYGIWEPVGVSSEPHLISFALVPGLAFTRDGRRLGRGKGYYDRFLAQLPSTCFKCGIGHDFQLVDELPTEPHDVLLDAVVTPGAVYRRTDWLQAK